MFHVLFALIYSILFLSLSGITSTALAAVSCNDPIYAGTSYKYANALDHFIIFQGNTYAIARSASTGNGAAPDGYFAMSANIDAQYSFTGVDNGSLRKLLATGIYGAAQPVTIPDAATQAFIMTYYGQYLGKASSPASTYVNAWKDYGAGAQFTQMTGGALAFSNWSSGTTPDVAKITAPEDVTMGADGFWVNGQDGQCLAQIVEFPGQQLDCATDVTATSPPPASGPGPAQPGQVCVQDLNGDGIIQQNEMAACVQTPQGLFCPVGVAPCSQVTGSPLCPAGTTLDQSRNMCQAAPSVVCGAGYSWDPIIDMCFQPVSCPDGGNFNTVTGACEKLVGNTCPAGYTYDSNRNTCWMQVNCQGGTYVPARDRCELPVSEGCTDPTYTYVPADQRCEKTPLCPQGSYNATYAECLQNFTQGCPSGYASVPFDSRCEETPLCSQGTFNPGDNECEWVSVSSYQAAANYSCPNGGTLNGTTCSGTYAATLVTVGAGNFDTPVYNHSQSGFSLCDANGTLGIHNTCYCTQPTGYIASGAFNAAIPVYNHSAGGFTICDANGELGINNTFNCSQAAGYVATEAFQGAVPVYNHSLGGFSFCDANSELGINNTFNCSKATAYMAPSQGTYGGTTSYSCNAGDTLTGTTCTHTYLAAATFTCNSGDNLSGTTCYHNTLNQISPVCPSGQMDYAHHVCFAAYTPQCPAGMTLDSVSGLCAQPATCANGLLDAAKNVCYQGSAASCPAPWTLDTANGICSSLPVCADGTFDATSGQCLATVVQDCGTYTWNAADGKCIQAVNCPRDPSFSENNTTGFSATLHECVSQAEHDCVLQTSYNGLPVEKCEAVPVCSGSGVFDPVQHACVMGNACPLGSQYACMDYNGSLQCSQNQCIDPANPPGGQTVDQGEDTMLEDDARNPDGSCAGQIMIFNGKASRCRPPGLTVGMMNDCCKSDKFTSEDTGDQVMGAVTTAKAVYQIGEVAYYTYEMYSGAMDFAQVGEAVSSAGESVISSVGAAEEAMAGGADMATGMADAMGEYMSAMCGPQMVVGLVVMVVMKILMGGGCDQRDIQCGEMTAARECHYLGDYCEKHWFYGCVQMAKGYCCFDSMMARIIQEQGRPQLTAFGPTGSWGTPDQPNCRGFTPEEFEAIDFAGIDFSEYISVIQQNLSTKIQDAQTTIGTTIQNRVNQITK